MIRFPVSDEFFIQKVNDWLAGSERFNSGYSIEVKKYRELENDHPLMLSIMQNRIFDEENDVREEILSLPILSRLIIRDEVRQIELSPQDIGVGISQVLPVLVSALHQRTGILAVEQPELHIHPAFQVTLGDLFIEQIRERPDLNFILETHSEHLTLRFLRRIRETNVKMKCKAIKDCLQKNSLFILLNRLIGGSLVIEWSTIEW